MEVNKINYYLSHCPAIIAQRAEEENKHYAEMITLHENYKRQRAKLLLEMKAKGDEGTQKEKEYLLDTNEELNKIKDAELEAEINHRAWRAKKEKARDLFEAAKALGYNQRLEWRSGNDTIPK